MPSTDATIAPSAPEDAPAEDSIAAGVDGAAPDGAPRPEQVDDDQGPAIDASSTEPLSENKYRAKAAPGPERIPDDGAAPVPFVATAAGAGSRAKSDAAKPISGARAGAGAALRDEESIVVPSREEIEGGAARGGGKAAPRGELHSEQVVDGARETDAVALPRAQDVLHLHSSVAPEAEETPVVPEAFLVEEDEAYDVVEAEPLPPWWRQKRTLLLSGACLLTAVAAVAIGVSLSVSASKPGEPMLTPTSAQIETSAPSSSAAPSLSPAPSASPTTCSYKITSRAQTIPIQPEGASNPQVAVDGTNMVVAARRDASVYVVFYLLGTEGWKSVNVFPLNDESGDGYAVALADGTALVGLPSARTAMVFEQLDWGGWTEAEARLDVLDGGDESASDDDFRWFLGLDRGLACAGHRRAIAVFRHDGRAWEEIDKADGELYDGCFVSGSTVGINARGGGLRLFRYGEGAGEAVPVPGPETNGGVKAAVMSPSHLVYSTHWEDAIHIYHRERNGPEFALSQQLDNPDYIGDRLALDGDILVIGGQNHSYVLSEQSGIWEETLVLDRTYDQYHLSGRNLIAVKDGEVHSYNLGDCVQDMPTQMPSLSLAPTSCVPVEISLSMASSDSHAVRWKLTTSDGAGNGELVESYAGEEGDATSHSASLCLPAGEYEFTISFDSEWEGVSSAGEYSIVSDGNLIVQKSGDWQHYLEVSARFILPYVSSAAAVERLAPSSQPVGAG